uniref:uncharacterized protein LOC117611465 n=1 Tax=Osmia lignaria TaxID=473952 RepID=UPI0014795FAC|nr:uncharacterized protein LOC117611465 [Osmia lignaria]XP_034195350.1 uncharacterized protein LOC117611514 [Osmia lignaria]
MTKTKDNVPTKDDHKPQAMPSCVPIGSFHGTLYQNQDSRQQPQREEAHSLGSFVHCSSSQSSQVKRIIEDQKTARQQDSETRTRTPIPEHQYPPQHERRRRGKVREGPHDRLQQLGHSRPDEAVRGARTTRAEQSKKFF